MSQRVVLKHEKKIDEEWNEFQKRFMTDVWDWEKNKGFKPLWDTFQYTVGEEMVLVMEKMTHKKKQPGKGDDIYA